jgi:hypothetical protein
MPGRLAATEGRSSVHGRIPMKRVIASLGMMIAGLMPLAATLILLARQ